MRVAIVHYWWMSNRGGEAVVKAIVDLYPHADLYLHVCDEAMVREALGPAFTGRIHRSFIAKLPGAGKHYQKYLPLMPLALEQFDLSAYDLVISSESGPAKGVITRPDALHICYCHTPMRYLWDMYGEYLAKARGPIKWGFPLVAHWMRVWDRASADRVDAFVANSGFVAQRIAKWYRRPADVIHPPVNTDSFDPSRPRDAFYLCLGQLVPYKRVDLVVQAFNTLGLPLVVIGEGEALTALQAIAKPNVRLIGRQPFAVVQDHLQRCRALVFPGLEDFGIVPVEAMAAGAPVIAYGKGGALETVIDGKTGVLMPEQSVAAIIAAVRQVELAGVTFDSATLAAHARDFDVSVFKQRFGAYVARALAQRAER